MLSFEFPDTIGKYVLNFKYFVTNKEMNLDTFECHCSEYVNFTDDAHEHVVLGNLDLIIDK